MVGKKELEDFFNVSPFSGDYSDTEEEGLQVSEIMPWMRERIRGIWNGWSPIAGKLRPRSDYELSMDFALTAFMSGLRAGFYLGKAQQVEEDSAKS